MTHSSHVLPENPVPDMHMGFKRMVYMEPVLVQTLPHTRRTRAPVLAALWLILLFATAQAQTAPPSSPVMQEQASLWNTLEDAVHGIDRLMTVADGDAIKGLLSSECRGMQTPEFMASKAMKKRAEMADRDNGLELRGGYTLGSLNDSLTDEQGRAYLELSWDVLREGYRARNDQAEAMRKQADVIRLQGEVERHKRIYRCRRLTIANTFATLRVGLLAEKLRFLVPVHEIERRAYFKGWSHLDDLLVSDGELRALRGSVQRLNDPNLLDTGKIDQQPVFPPAIDVDLDGILHAIQSDDRDEHLYLAARQAAYFKARANNQKDRLRLFLRNSFTQGNRQFRNEGLAAGIRFAMPLSRQSLEGLDDQLDSIENRHGLEAWRRVNRTRLAYIELHEQLERTTEQHFRYLRAENRARRSLSGRLFDASQAELITAIVRTRTLIDAAMEYVKAVEETYQRVNEIFLQARVSFDPALVKHLNLPDTAYRARTGERSLYLWSKTFNQLPNTQLLRLADVKGIDEIILSAGKKLNRKKADHLIRLARRNGIDVSLMLGDASWIFSEKHQAAITRSVLAAEMTGRLHLDIEPHTLEDYKENRSEYLSAYLGLLRKIRQVLPPEYKLSVSVPVHWENQVYKELADLADSVYLMAYETDSFNTINKRINPILKAIPKEQVALALRPQDFEDEWHMENIIDKIHDRWGISRFAIHDTRTYIDLTGQGR